MIIKIEIMIIMIMGPQIKIMVKQNQVRTIKEVTIKKELTQIMDKITKIIVMIVLDLEMTTNTIIIVDLIMIILLVEIKALMRVDI